MSVTPSSRAERLLWPAWGVFAAANTALMFMMPGTETVPFHFVWISLSLVYGLRPLPLGTTYAVLAVVGVLTGSALVLHVHHDVIGWEETTEVPLMTLVFLAMVWHVRRRKRAEMRAQQLATSEHTMREAQRRFVKFASHELRTPVTVARGYTELIRSSGVDAQVRDDAEVVLDELDRLGRISTRLLTLARIDERSSLKPRSIDLDALMQRTIKRWRVTADRSWVIDARAGTVVADPERLEAALDSLLDNAVRYTQVGGRIELTGSTAGGSACIRLRDDGLGIPESDRHFVFESFRVGSVQPGTGMGLAIVRAVVEAHGGTATVRGRRGAGSEFELCIPVDGPPQPPAAPEQVTADGSPPPDVAVLSATSQGSQPAG